MKNNLNDTSSSWKRENVFFCTFTYFLARKPMIYQVLRAKDTTKNMMRYVNVYMKLTNKSYKNYNKLNVGYDTFSIFLLINVR